MEEKELVSRWGSRRALSTPIAAIVMLVVIVAAGAGAYFGLAAMQPAKQTVSSCQPASSSYCGGIVNGNVYDVQLYAPFPSAYTGTPIAFTGQLPVGEVATSWMFNFGDGTNATSSTPTATHSYAQPGTYLVLAQAFVNGAWHSSYKGNLLTIHIAASSASSGSGTYPSVTGRIVANSSSTTLPTAILGSSGGTVWLTGSYTGAPTNPVFVPQLPTYVASSGVTLTSSNQTSASEDASAVVSAPGIYWVSFVGEAKSPTANAFQNFTWTIVVPPSGINAGSPVAAATQSQHKNQLVVYELAPGGASSEDPAIAYDTVSYEPILNVYQTLIAYNGSQSGPTPSNFFPELATCVPGSAACTNLYSGKVASGPANLSDGVNFTFVVSAAPQFYDPVTQAHWGVWPTDVVFSLARTMSFSTLPCVECNNGWIVTQSLISNGNPNWAGAGFIHGQLNNTPQNIMASMTINDSNLCPSTAMTQDHGCVTFHANANGVDWPYFLELIADNLGASVVSCGWMSAAAQGAGIPYWTEGNSSGAGDHPCGAMGTAGWGVDPATISPNAWDNYQIAGSGLTGTFLGNVQWAMVGSGPYYLKAITVGGGYTLSANPDYAPNSNCNVAACQPAVGHYAAQVSVVWENSETPGEQSYQAGIADFASIPATQAGFAIQLSQQGKIGITSFPTISIYFFPFNLYFNKATVGQWATSPVNIDPDFFSYVGVRQFFVTAYPYQQIQNTISTKDGIQYLFNYGGAIPQFMANYYASNVSWPSGDPATNCAVGSSTANGPLCASYWWTQLTTSTSPYYDANLTAKCTSSTPCTLATFGQLGAPDLDQRFALWNAALSTYSGGAIQATTTDLTFHNLVVLSLGSGAYGNPMPMYNLGWAPDYPDPTDYVGPMYAANATYTLSDTVYQQLTNPIFDGSGCTVYTNYVYWASNPVPNNCQGAAYRSMLYAMNIAASTPPGTERTFLYNQVSQISSKLALYGYYGQANEVITYASYIDPTTLNTNIVIGGGGDQTWFTVAGTNVW